MVTAPSSTHARTRMNRIVALSCAFVTACALALTGQPVSARAAEQPQHTVQSGTVRVFQQTSPQDISEDASYSLNVVEATATYEPEETLIHIAEESKGSLHAVDNTADIEPGYDSIASGLDLQWDTTRSQYTKNMLKVAFTGPAGSRLFMYALGNPNSSDSTDSNSADSVNAHSEAHSMSEDGEGYEIAPSGSWLVQEGQRTRSMNWVFTQPGDYTLSVRSLAQSDNGAYSNARNYTYRVKVGRQSSIPSSGNPSHGSLAGTSESSGSQTGSHSSSSAESSAGDEPGPAGSDDHSDGDSSSDSNGHINGEEDDSHNSDKQSADESADHRVEENFNGDTAQIKAPQEHPIDPKTGKELLARTHVDAAHVYWDKATQKLSIGVIDGSTLRPADKVSVRLGPDADTRDGREVSRIKLPSNGALSFLGKPGDIVWNAPGQWYQGHHPVWAGIGAGKMPDSVNPYSLNLKLLKVTGPGWVSVWRSGSDFVAQDLDTRNPEKMSMSLVAGGHGHYNWSFSQPGRYSMVWQATVAMRNGTKVESPEYTVDWLVGHDKDVNLPAGFTPSSTISIPAEQFTEASINNDFGSDTSSSDGGEEPELPRVHSCLVPGHYDLMAKHDSHDGQLHMTLADDSGSQRVFHKSYTAVIPVPDFASHTLSDNSPSVLKQLGAQGSRVWTLPQIQDRDLGWFGMNTQELDYRKIINPGVKAEISDFSGPGRMMLWDSNILDGSHTLLDTANFDRSIFFENATHRHMATTFNKPGLHKASYSYEVTYDKNSGYRNFAYDYYDVYYAVGDDAIKSACGQDFFNRYGVRHSHENNSDASSADKKENHTDDDSHSDNPSRTQNDREKNKRFSLTLDRGHADIFNVSLKNNAEVELNLKEDVTGTGVIHQPEDVLLRVNRQAYYAHLPQSITDIVKAQSAYVLPQTQDSRVLWPGWDTQEIASAGYESAAFDISYTGPRDGRIAMWIHDAFAGAQSRLVDKSFILKPSGSTILQPYPAHSHANWAFTKPGRYVLKVRARIFDKNRAQLMSKVRTYTIDVGDERENGSVAKDKRAQVSERASENSREQAGVKVDSTTFADQWSGCRETTITREATEQEARELSQNVSRVPVNSARTTLTFSVGPQASGNATQGHFDLGPVVEGDTLVARIKDDRVAGGRWVDPRSLVFAVGSSAQINAPSSLSFVTHEGHRIWSIPSTQIAGVPWLGLNSQHPQLSARTNGAVNFTLDSVSGPGKFAVFSAGAFGSGVGAHVFDAAGSSYTLPAHTHAHYNWVFTEPGIYRVTITMRVTPTSGNLRGSGFYSGNNSGVSRLTLTGSQGEHGRPMVQETVGRRSDGTACALAETGVDTSLSVVTVAFCAVVGITLGLCAYGSRRRYRRSLNHYADNVCGAYESSALQSLHNFGQYRNWGIQVIKRLIVIITIAACVCSMSACSSPWNENYHNDAHQTRKLNVVTTTGILADLARNVAGEYANVTQLIPNGADPHSWEPSLRSIRDIAYADVAITNYLLLEQHSLIRTLDANLPENATSVSLAEEATKSGATVLPLVENRALDTVWLGMRVAGRGTQYGAKRSSQIDLSVTSVKGPGDAAAYITTTFGAPEVSFASSDGFNPSDGYAADTSTLPADAHQHMSWAFMRPGVYIISVQAKLRVDEKTTPINLGQSRIMLAVGVDAQKAAHRYGRHVISSGHADVTVDLNYGGITLMADRLADGKTPIDAPEIDKATQIESMAAFKLDDVIIDVPTRTLTQVPTQKQYRFIAAPGADAYILAQAVLGKHVHGEIDPHLWHDVHNAGAYVKVIRDTLARKDPQHAREYHSQAQQYLRKLESLDEDMTRIISTIDPQKRQLITTNDAYGYLAHAYAMSVAGFVTPNPSTEPSIADRKKLIATLRDLKIPAVFLEPQLARTRSVLKTVAQENNVRICPLYGDTLDDNASTYIDMMRFNARSLATCLGGKQS
ncbi:anchored repeat ABC transporter, substrate-binding protein [Alloscardovia theropitheci]|uniref:Anchored repeat ABC transporter, substrate-binding protein n=1 Tax=Alloscardovia theropitheci TaxID=2496842 RepID=A0A4R0R059_9BIFI|nr:anchored repeat ABC transporter, substrate-binding protein [Alloscardovia theropitheci]TCD54376.1 anchored repeat ABC transporter, substrate-binding protein [Alloscardovia theropitheci]